MVYPHTYRTEHSETKTSNSVYGDYYAEHQSKRIAIQPDLLKIIQYIDSHRDTFRKDLSDIIAIKSVSGDLTYKGEMEKMLKFVEKWLVKLGLKYEPFNIGDQELAGQKVPLSNIILASFGRDPSKKTICIYANIDVKHPDSTLWRTDPWKVVEADHRFFGCGVAQGKSTLLHWFHVIEAFQRCQIEFPVNLKLVIEGMYHWGSVGLADFLPLRKHDFFVDIDSIIVCDSEWIGEKHPCIIYGTVGLLHFDLFAQKGGNSESDPRADLDKIAKEIVDDEERVLIPHFEDTVTQVTPEEEKTYEAICDFEVEDIRGNLPAFKQKWDKVQLLMSHWRIPSIFVDKTEECTCPDKGTTLVKRRIIVKIVPRQIINSTSNQVINHVSSIVKKLNIQNTITCEPVSATRYWHENVANASIQAARRATIQIYKEDPSLIREDGANVLITILDRVLETFILLLPLVCRGSNAGGANESVTVRNFYESTKLLAAYLLQIK